MTYSDLVATIAAYMHRSDLATISATFVALAESRIYRDCRVKEMITTQTIAYTGNTMPLPDRYQELRSVTYRGGPWGPYALRSVGQHLIPLMSEAGTSPQAYSTEGTLLQIEPGADGKEFDLLYYAGLAPLGVSNQSNAMLDAYPGMFLYGSLLEAAIYVQDPQLTAQFTQSYNTEVQNANSTNAWSRWGESPTMSTA